MIKPIKFSEFKKRIIFLIIWILIWVCLIVVRVFKLNAVNIITILYICIFFINGTKKMPNKLMVAIYLSGPLIILFFLLIMKRKVVFGFKNFIIYSSIVILSYERYTSPRFLYFLDKKRMKYLFYDTFIPIVIFGSIMQIVNWIIL